MDIGTSESQFNQPMILSNNIFEPEGSKSVNLSPMKNYKKNFTNSFKQPIMFCPNNRDPKKNGLQVVNKQKLKDIIVVHDEETTSNSTGIAQSMSKSN